MSFICPMCREEYLFISKLCPKCDRIRFIMSCYSRDKVLEVVEKVFLIEKFKDEIEDEKYIKKDNGKWIEKECLD